MLNYIFLFLIAVGILVALGNDISDIRSDRFHNGTAMPASISFNTYPSGPLENGKPYPCTILFTPADLSRFYGESYGSVLVQNATLIPSASGRGVLKLQLDAYSPKLWKSIATATKSADALLANVSFPQPTSRSVEASIQFDPVRFLNITAVTNDGIIKYAKTAVELAIGLIGIMALWMGLMKIAEQSGLVAALGRALRPVTRWLFPDVPPDHPAMGAMIMNISANMLGVSNAATPFGLKAMEELNKLNPKAGTATDAMCTFLVINTGNVQLIPATVIAIRAAAGSANATEILGPVIVATACSLVVGLVTVKLLARLPIYRKQLATEPA